MSALAGTCRISRRRALTCSNPRVRTTYGPDRQITEPGTDWAYQPGNNSYAGGEGAYLNAVGVGWRIEHIPGGTKVAIGGILTSLGGNFDVYVDGVKIGTGSCYAAPNRYGLHFPEFTLPPGGLHQVKVLCTSGYIWFDQTSFS